MRAQRVRAKISGTPERPRLNVYRSSNEIYAQNITKDFIDKYSYLIYVVALLVLLITIVIAEDTKGSRSWLHLGPVSIQPAEFSKFATALALAKFIDSNKLDLSNWNALLKSALIFIIPLLLIICQKETGTAIVFIAFFLVLFREGMNATILLIGFCMVLFFILGIKYAETVFANQLFSVGVWLVLSLIQIITTILVWMFAKERRITVITFYINIGGMLLGMSVSMLVYPFDVTILQIVLISLNILLLLYRWLKDMTRQYLYIALFAICSVGYLYSVDYVFEKVLEPHQQVRINVILGLEDDPYGAGYNVNQSKIAIGSGGFSGKGFMKGTQTKLKYVPEQDTDFIFCTVGEEQGFLGSTFVLLLYLSLLLRLVYLADFCLWQGLWVFSGIYTVFPPIYKYRYGAWNYSCHRYSIAILQLWWLFTMGLYYSVVPLPAYGLRTDSPLRLSATIYCSPLLLLLLLRFWNLSFLFQ